MKKLAILMTILCLYLSSCTTDTNITKINNEYGFEYSVISIEDMPCLLVTSPTSYGYYVRSITCDWSRWKDN